MTAAENPIGETAVLIDATVFNHALGEPGPWRQGARRLLFDLAAGKGRGYVSTEAVQEVVFHRLRRTGDRRSAAANGRDIAQSFIVLDFDHEVLDASLGLIERTAIRGRDAVHAATALVYGIGMIASSDPAFDAVPGLTRIDPLAA